MVLNLLSECGAVKSAMEWEERLAAVFFLAGHKPAFPAFETGTRQRLAALMAALEQLPRDWARELAWEVLLQ